MPKTPLFKTVGATANELQTNAEAAFKTIEQQTQNVLVFKLMVEQAIAQLLVDNIGNFVSALIPQLLSNPAFQDGISGASFGNVASAINDPQNLEVKQALAQFLEAYFGLTPTTPIEPIE